jgi:hypothetical protein
MRPALRNIRLIWSALAYAATTPRRYRPPMTELLRYVLVNRHSVGY